MSAVPFPSSYTAASSLESLPTRSFGSRGRLPFDWSISSSICGDILQPQPAPWLYDVSLGVLVPALKSVVVWLEVKVCFCRFFLEFLGDML